MQFRCLRHGVRGYIRRGSVTGERVATYSKSRKTINDSGIVNLSREKASNPLCPDCMKELAGWIKDKSKRVR